MHLVCPPSAPFPLPLRLTLFVPPFLHPTQTNTNSPSRAESESPLFPVPYRMDKRTLRNNGPAYATRETQLTPTPPSAAFMAMDDSSSSALASSLPSNANNFRQFFSAPGCLPPPTMPAAAAATTEAAATATATSSSATGRPTHTGERPALATEMSHSNNGAGREGADIATGNNPKFASTSSLLSSTWSSSWASSISGRLGRVGARLISPGVSKRGLQVRACVCDPAFCAFGCYAETRSAFVFSVFPLFFHGALAAINTTLVCGI